MALGVLYNHSFVMFYPKGYTDATAYIFKYFDSGSLSVCVFFLISGMLLTQSFFKTKSKLKFVFKRIFRLFPALLVCLLFTVFIVGALGTNLSFKTYFTSRDTYRYFYNIFLNNELFIYNIPGSFTTNKTPEIINGSLWTLPYEFVCYIFLFLGLCALMFLKNNKSNILLKSLIAALIIFFSIYLFNGKFLIERFKGLVTGFNQNFNGGNNPIKLFVFFFSGSFLYFFRNKIKRSKLLFAIILSVYFIVFIFSQSLVLNIIFEYILIIYSVIMFSGARFLSPFNSKVDPSYGVYLYAWPIQQLIAFYMPGLSAYESLIYTVPVVLILGTISYLLIERPLMERVNPVYNFVNRPRPINK